MFSLSKISHKHTGKLLEKWVFDSHSNLVSGAAIEDIDRDGLKEIIFGTTDGKIICVDERKTQKWVYEVSNEISEEDSFFYDKEQIDSIPAIPTLADIDGDEFSEIIFSSGLGIIHCLDYKGKLLWKKDTKSKIKASIVVDDIDNDGFKEILVVTSLKKLLILSNHGELKTTIEVDSPIEGMPVVFKSKKQTQIIFGTNSGSIYSHDTEGKLLWVFKATGKITAQPFCINLGKYEGIIVGDHVGYLYCLNVEGELVWRFKTEGSIYSQVSVDDINDDGKLEIVFGSCDNKVYCLTNNGNLLWSYETDFWVVAKPIIVDIDGDGRKEVVVGSYDQHLYVLDGEGEYNLDFVPGLSGLVHQAGSYTNVLTKDPGTHIGKRLWKLKLQGLIVGCDLFMEGEERSLIINTKKGLVDDIVHVKA